MAMFGAAGADPAFVLPAFAVSPQEVGLLRWATAGYLSAPTDEPPNTQWEPRLLDDVVLSQSAADAMSVGGVLSLGLGEIGLADADGALADLDRWGTADGRSVTIRAVPVVDAQQSDAGTPLAGRALGMRLDLMSGTATIIRTDPVVAFRGIVQRVDRGAGRTGTLRLTDVVERLSTPLQPTKYLGNGGLEGGDDLEGKPKPVCLGHAYNVSPVFLGDVDLSVGIGALPTYQVHWREVAEIEAVRIRGVSQTLVTGTPGIGQARGFPLQGMLQLGGAPDGAVTADVRGDAVGGFVSSLPGVVRRLVGSLGPQLGPDDIDPVAFTFAEEDLAGEIGWYQGAEDITAAMAAADLVGACGAVLTGGRAGRLRLWDPLAIGTDQFALTMPHILDLRPLPMPESLRPLPREAAVGWRRNWTPLSDVAESVPAADRERLGNEQAGPVRAASPAVTKRVAQQRTLSFRGLYWAQVDALARASRWRNWLARGPRMFQLVTDRYLSQVECGHVGRIAYPAWGLDGGVRVTVIGWAERLSARRLELTVITQPEA
jgi:hypothetical protein